MILMKDVTHYTVGDDEFKVGAIFTDHNGHAHIAQGYRLAYERSQEIGKPIIAHGLNSVRSELGGWDYEVAAA